jgi:hypothetical protein
MRRHRQEPPATGFRGSELRWLLSGVLMLVVLFLLISRLREPGAFNWLADLNQNAKQQSPASAGELPKATGDTDEDIDQAETAKEEFQGITDGPLNLGQEEMPIYNRLVFWVKNQPFARLWARAKKNPAYTYLYDEPQEHRGQLAAFDATACLINNGGKNDAGVPLHEVWATTQQSGSRFYVFIVVDLPAKMPIGRSIREPVKFAGYFLKLQGYHPTLSKPGQAPEKAPLLIGRIEWTPTAASSADESREWIWGSVALGLIAVGLAVRFVLGKLGRRNQAPRGILTPAPDAVIPVDQWLEQSGFASPDDEEPDEVGGESSGSPNGP